MKSFTPLTSATETLTELGACGLKVWQPLNGYRFSLDAYLLADFVDEEPETDLFEVGYGSGVIAILLAARGLSVSGIEIQPQMAELASRSVALNGLSVSCRLSHGDFREYCGGPHDAIVSNPPYRPLQTGRINPDSARAQSRHELSLRLNELALGLKRNLKTGGRFYCIYPAWRLVDLLAALRENGIEPKKLRMVHSAQDTPAQLCLVSAIKGGGRELSIDKPLFVYKAAQQYSDEVASVFAGLGQQKPIDR